MAHFCGDLVKMNATDIIPAHPFTHPGHFAEDTLSLKHALNEFLVRLPSIIDSGLNAYAAVEVDEYQAWYQRCFVSDVARLLGTENFFTVGFMGFGKETVTNDVKKAIWDLDQKLLETLKAMPNILAYITWKKYDGQYCNLVLMDNEKAKEHWMQNMVHHHAVALSPQYYSSVRIHNFILNGPLGVDTDVAALKFELLKTVYCSFKYNVVWWRGVRYYDSPSSSPSLTSLSPSSSSLSLVSLSLSSPLPSSPSLLSLKTPTLLASRISERRPLRFASFMGHVQYEFHKQVAQFVGKALCIPIEVVPINQINDSRFEKHAFSCNVVESILEFNIDFAFICGVSFFKFKKEVLPVVAPVRAADRYGGKPVYYSDVIVKKVEADASRYGDKGFSNLCDLRGAIFGYNERCSYSGYHMIATRLYNSFGTAPSEFFFEMKRTTSHAASIQQVLAGLVHCAAIDSTVLEMEMRKDQDRLKTLRNASKNGTDSGSDSDSDSDSFKSKFDDLQIVHSLGPAPMPPLVARKRVGKELITAVADILLSLANSADGLAMLTQNGYSGFARVTESDYDDIHVWPNEEE